MKRILIVDDEKMIRDVMEAFFTSFGYEVVTAVDGLDALEKFVPGAFDCVISDCMMPRMEGTELLEHIRSRDRKVVFFLITGVPDERYKQDSLKMGADEFICKPVNMADVTARIEAAILRKTSIPQVSAGDMAHQSSP